MPHLSQHQQPHLPSWFLWHVPLNHVREDTFSQFSQCDLILWLYEHIWNEYDGTIGITHVETANSRMYFITGNSHVMKTSCFLPVRKSKLEQIISNTIYQQYFCYLKQNISYYSLYIFGPRHLQNWNTRKLGSRARQKYCISAKMVDSCKTWSCMSQAPQAPPPDTTRQLQTSGAAVFLGWNQGGAIINSKLPVYKFLLFHAQFFV